MSRSAWRRYAWRLSATAATLALVTATALAEPGAAGAPDAGSRAQPSGSSAPDAGPRSQPGAPDAGSQPSSAAPGAGGSAAPPACSCAPPPAAPCAKAPGAPEAGPGNRQARLAQAKQLFQQGNALRKAGDYQRALDFYNRSRALVPSAPNTLDAAVCLQKLGRNAEALELYETLLTQFGDKLGADEKQAIGAATRQLRKKVASVEVSANVAGLVVIDGRMRGTLPMSSPLRVMPGKHVVRVLKDGFKTFEKRVTLRAGETNKIDARLDPLSVAGRLRVEAASTPGADLYVDGALLGKVPWEGTLAPGPHIYVVRKGDLGTAPGLVTVVKGQIVLVRAQPKPLGHEIRILVDPPNAPLTIDDVPVGVGSWRGRLPLGKHVLEAREEGYRPGRISRLIADNSGDIKLHLEVDPESPRWGGRPSRIFVEASGGYAFTGSLGSGAESSCSGGHCSSNTLVGGALVAVRAGYELPIHVAFEVSGGYLTVSKSLTRTLQDTYDNGTGGKQPIAYTYDDHIRLSGPFAAVGLAYRPPLGPRFGLDLRVDVGGVLMSSSDHISASATAGGRSTQAAVQGEGTAVGSAALFVMPAAEVRMSFGAYHLGAGLAVPVFPLQGPRNANGNTGVLSSGQCPANPTPPPPVECAKQSSAVASERAYGAFALVVPMVAAGYTF